MMEMSTTDPTEFYTTGLCFEIEIIKKLLSSRKTAMIRQIALDLDNQAENFVLDVDFVQKHFRKMGIDLMRYTPKKLCDVRDDDTDFCQMYSAWFMAKKGVLLGRIIGDSILKDDIPACYSDAIKKAEEVARSV